MSLFRPKDIPALLHDRQLAECYRQEAQSGPVEVEFSCVQLNAPTRTDLEQFEEIWVGQVYGMVEAFVPKPGWTVVDVGANIGCFTLWAATHMRRGQLWAFEPIPQTFEYLERNIQSNSHRFSLLEVQTQACAIADVEDTLPMVLVAEATGWNRLISEEALINEQRATIKVPAHLLDSRVPETQVDLLKVDVEGAELQVLRGATRMLRQTDRVVMEYHSAELLRDCRGLLESVGFHLVTKTREHNLGIAYFSR